MSLPDERIEAAGLLLLTRDPGSGQPSQFLLMKHRDRWDLPKGHAESGESPIETALRETMEETGIDTDRISLIDDFAYELSYPVRSHRHGGETRQKRVTYFMGWVASPLAIRCTEHESYAWMDWNPPHRIQHQTIDGLLGAAAQFFSPGP